MSSQSKSERAATEETTAPPEALKRRGFLAVTSSLALGAASFGFRSKASADPIDALLDGIATRPELSTSVRHRDLRKQALLARIRAAKAQFELPIAPHATTGDEQRYGDHVGSDTRGLPHDELGRVDPQVWQQQLAALKSGSFEELERVKLGGSRKFVNPIGTLTPSLEGANVTQISIPAPPALESAERTAEAVEQYWQSVLRDVPLSELGTHPDALAAGQELERLPGYAGPRRAGRVTGDVLFRGTVAYVDPSDRSGRRAKHVTPPGVLDGPYLSQFVLRDTPYGTQSIPALQRLPRAGQDFLLTFSDWLAVQNGVAPSAKIELDSVRRHVRTIRDLNEYAHGGNPLFWGAALQLGAGASGSATAPAGIGAPVSPTNPYLASKTQASGNASFGLGYLQALLNVGVSRAIRAAYWSKWFVHRSVRPEAFGGLVHQHAEGIAEHPISDELLASQALARAFDKFGTHLLAQAYPEGAPIHGSYPAGSAATAGVSATLLKAHFDESFVIPNPVVVDPNDPTRLVPYDGPQLTVGGEINKLAVNYTFGRVLAGIHWRSDAAAGLALGEQIAISILQDERLTIREPFAGFTLTKFDGTTITI